MSGRGGVPGPRSPDPRRRRPFRRLRRRGRRAWAAGDHGGVLVAPTPAGRRGGRTVGMPRGLVDRPAPTRSQASGRHWRLMPQISERGGLPSGPRRILFSSPKLTAKFLAPSVEAFSYSVHISHVIHAGHQRTLHDTSLLPLQPYLDVPPGIAIHPQALIAPGLLHGSGVTGTPRLPSAPWMMSAAAILARGPRTEEAASVLDVVGSKARPNAAVGRVKLVSGEPFAYLSGDAVRDRGR